MISLHKKSNFAMHITTALQGAAISLWLKNTKANLDSWQIDQTALQQRSCNCNILCILRFVILVTAVMQVAGNNLILQFDRCVGAKSIVNVTTLLKH